MKGRFPGRVLIFATLLFRLPWQWLRRKPQPQSVQRILVLHQFLLGDALMATSLLAKLRERFPAADIVLACPPLQAGLYDSQPYGIRAMPWHPRDFASIRRLFALPRVDMVYLMGENRLSYLARAIGARWIVGFDGEVPHYKNWLVDERIPYAQEPEAWTDTAARLVEGPAPQPFDLAYWPLGEQRVPALPARYVVLHVGASSPTRYWPSEYWQSLAASLRERGLAVVWSGGPGEHHLIERVTPLPQDVVISGSLTLPQLRAVLAAAQACVCPDTGIAHLAKTAGVPLVMLFGPGSEELFGASHFFSRYTCLGAGPALFPCRFQRSVHHRPVDWALRCFRPAGALPGGCKQVQCMAAVRPEAVIDLLHTLSCSDSTC